MCEARVLLAALSLMSVVHAAAAQPQPGPNVSSRDEYRACLEEGDRLEPQRAALQKRLRDHNAALKALQEQMIAHAAGQSKVDTGDPAAVGAFNAATEALNTQMKASNDRGDALQREQSDFNAAVAAANQRCANMSVTSVDRDAVLRQRAARQ